MDIGACGLTLQLEFANSAQGNSFAQRAPTMFFPHFVSDAGSRKPHKLRQTVHSAGMIGTTTRE
jgi:hypothetical protein